jgi:amidohydrolase
MTPDFHAQAEALLSWMSERRRDFHRHPELGFQEVRTAGIVAQELNSLGLEVTTGVGKTGVVGLLEGDRPGPTVLLRFDMDALPIHETNTTDYVSQNAGVMHACGHDGHTAIGLAVAKMLAPLRTQLAGTLKFVFQPAEEGLGGAEAMVADGVMDTIGPKVERSLALHLWNESPVGWVAATDGPAMAASERFYVHLQGKGSHGAAPHQGRDPLLAGAQIVDALQSIVSRNTAPLESAVLSVTIFKAGQAFNVVPDTAFLGGTIRTFNPEVRTLVLQRIVAISEGVARALGCEAKVELKKIAPATVNEAGMAARVRELARSLPGVTEVVDNERTMGSEDMAYMMDSVPGCYFFVGSNNAEKELNFPHHHPRFDFDERALVIGAALMARAASDYVMG